MSGPIGTDEMLDRIEALEADLAAEKARADARVAAALRDAASMFARQAEDMKRDGDPYWEAEQDAENILALIPDAGASFDWAIAEARKDEREACADLVASCVWGDYWTLDGEPVEPLLLAAAIRARTTGEEQ